MILSLHISNLLNIQWQDPFTFAIILGAFVAFLFIFMILIVWQSKKYIETVKQEEANKLRLVKEHQQQLAQAMITSMEEERKRMAADLHDDLIGLLRRILLINKDTALEKDIQYAISTARNISHDLMPPMLEQLPMEELITYLVHPLREIYTVELNTRGTVVIPSEEKLHLFRILQELLSNIIKHAKADTLNIHFSNIPTRLLLTVQDNGIGMPEAANNGLGLQNIEMRCQLIDANYIFEKNKPKGTQFKLHKPVSSIPKLEHV